MATILLLDPAAPGSRFTLGRLHAAGHRARVLRSVQAFAHAVASDRPDVLVLVDVPGQIDAVATLGLVRRRIAGPGPSAIVLAGESRRREAGTAADLVLPLAAAEVLVTNAVNLVLQGRARDEGLMIHPAAPHSDPVDRTISEARRARTSPQPASVPVLPDAALPARANVNGYRVTRPLGRGGMAMVYLARHEETGEDRVLKLLPISEHDGGDLVQRLINEAVLLSQVDHPNVAKIHEHGFTDWHAYIAMEYLPGGDLRNVLGKPMPPDRAADALIQIAGALEAIHAAGIVHRDLKPENVMRRADGAFVLVDFGIARQSGVQLSYVGTGHVVGTAAYLAPEYLEEGASVDHRGDIYSLGVLFHEMLTGRKPFDARNPMHVLDMHMRAPVPRLPAPLQWAQPLVDRMMAKRPQDRFTDTAALVAAVRSALSGGEGGREASTPAA